MENFDAMPYHEKVFTIIRKGTFLNTIKHLGYNVDLYHVEGLYVELFYHPVTAKVNKIQKADETRLHLYSPINLNEDQT
ncbi:hypothetical protein [Chondrinema litorale]|uniref:hypothetical protein n=1 Tax=Chondrinema litorale TaxID=2994555 RepID=UPI0025438C59|nr:hypothetical protein [Chondrinema litorale]UZR98336.1 hypothetical protein OQ292_30525 [Chondrinema litorale]